MTWSFRLHFALSESQRIDAGEETSHVIPVSGHDLRLKSRGSLRGAGGDALIRDSGDLQIIGSGYPTQEVAIEAAHRWQQRLTVALASTHIGADLGARSRVANYVTADGQRWFRAQLGLASDDRRPIIGDRLGIEVYETASRPIFVGSTAKGVVVYSISNLDDALAVLNDVDHSASPAEQAAYDMFAISFFLPSPDAKFIALMMAMEALIERRGRNHDARGLIDEFITQTKNAGLDARESQSLVSALADLKRESIGQAGRRLAATLAPRTYADEPPDQFFGRCYSIRSRLVHGDDDRPELEEVSTLCPHLQRLVADLLSGPLVVDAAAEIPPPVRGIAMHGQPPSES